MRLPVSIFLPAVLLAVTASAADLPYFSVLSEDAGAWPEILSPLACNANRPASRAFVARAALLPGRAAAARVEKGAILILRANPLGRAFGFSPHQGECPRVGSLTDIHRPGLAIVWEKVSELPIFEIPAAAQVFARERWGGAPMSAGFRRGTGAVLWVAVPPGERGYERFPYLLNALTDLGLEPPFRSNRLWAFFDSSYRSRVDLDYFAARWRKSGIAALHVAAWHFSSPIPSVQGSIWPNW
jgi:hypothetical protein